MNTKKDRHLTQNENTKSREESLPADASDIGGEECDDHTAEKIFRQDPDMFLLNNLLMSVQFFENYERDIRRLREDWFKDITLAAHHKKCFYADSLFRLIGANVKFSHRHGMHKNSETSLHPLRIYITSDNIEAAFDPSALRYSENRLCPQYQFSVKHNEKKKKSGSCVQLIEHKTIEASDQSPEAAPPPTDFPTSRESVTSNVRPEQQQQNYVRSRRKSNFDPKNARRLTKTELFIGSQNNPRLTEKRASVNFFSRATDAVISAGDFYKFTNPETRVKPRAIHEFRMNSAVLTSCEIPLMCFQRQDIKQPFNAERRISTTENELNSVFKSQTVLNSAAFKGYFCDLLVERLAGALTLDHAAVSNSSVLDEFIMVNQSGMQYGIAPVIPIRDWNNFILINERLKGREKMKGLPWPSSYMQKIIDILPCSAVPIGHSSVWKENPDYEKEWTLAFPKVEEFLLLHMMHAHVRCYFFALLIYKSFLETEINVGSFGPKHLLHLLFWRVQKNFLAWPEDRPGETLLIYLKALYKKIQNKYLCDFFVTSRNIFATSLPNDLHKAQTLIKRIIENPIPCLIRALRNLQLKPNFYPPLDSLKLHAVLSAANTPNKSRRVKKEKKKKVVRFEDDPVDDEDEERQWKRNAIKQIELERKIDEDSARPSVDSINTDEELNFDTRNRDKCVRVLEIFFSHFLEMREKSLEFKFSSQALSYLSHARTLLDLMASKGGNKTEIKALRAKLNKLTDGGIILKHDSPESISRGQRLQIPVCKQAHTSRVEGSATEEREETRVNEIIKVKNKNENKNEVKWHSWNDGDASDIEIYETKL